MDLNLAGKNVVVTGSSKGIGQGIVQAFLSEGANVLSNARTEESNINHPKLSFIQGDVTTPDGLKAIQNKVNDVFGGKIDILVCNVGSGKSVKPGTEKRKDWQDSFETNFFSTTNVIESLGSKLNKNSSVIFISSICGLEHLGAPLTYTAAKSALNSYVVGLSKVLGKDGIRVNGIAPGNINFPGSVWDQKLQENSEAVIQMLEKDVALKKLGSVEDVAHMALFLSSDKANFITGSIIVVDGGQVRAW